MCDCTCVCVHVCAWVFMCVAMLLGVENMPAIVGTQSLIIGLDFVVLGPLIGKMAFALCVTVCA